MNQKKKKHPFDCPTPSSDPVIGDPVDAWDEINKYGEYEVQDTTETDNTFPLIGPLGAGATGVLLPDIPDPDSEEDKKNQLR